MTSAFADFGAAHEYLPAFPLRKSKSFSDYVPHAMADVRDKIRREAVALLALSLPRQRSPSTPTAASTSPDDADATKFGWAARQAWLERQIQRASRHARDSELDVAALPTLIQRRATDEEKLRSPPPHASLPTVSADYSSSLEFEMQSQSAPPPSEKIEGLPAASVDDISAVELAEIARQAFFARGRRRYCARNSGVAQADVAGTAAPTLLLRRAAALQ